MTIKSGYIFVGATDMKVIECYKCHILFAMPDYLDEQCREERGEKSFYCPNGHGQVYTGEKLETKLKRQLSNVQNCCDKYQEKVEKLEIKNRCMKGGYRAQLKRIKEEKE